MKKKWTVQAVQRAVNSGNTITRSLVILAAAIVMTAGLRAQGESVSHDQARTVSEEGWLQRQVKRFRSYPRLDRAYRLLERGYLNEASKEIEAYLSIQPGDESVRVLYASLLYQTGRLRDAIRESDRLLIQSPSKPTVRLNRAMALQASNQLDKAEEDFRLVMLDPAAERSDRLFATTSYVDLACARENHQACLSGFDQLARLNPNASQSFSRQHRRAIALLALGRTREAEEVIRAAANSAPTGEDKVMMLKVLATLANGRDDVNALRTNLVAALAIDPSDVAMMRTLVEVERQAGNLDKAIEWHKRVLAINSTIMDREVLIELLQQKHDHAEVIAQCSRLLQHTKLANSRVRLLMIRGFANHAIDRFVEAAADFTEALSLRPDENAQVALLNTLDAAGKSAQAIELLEQWIGEQPRTEWMFRVGNLYELVGDHAKAGRSFRVVAHKLRSAELHRRSAMLFIQAGEDTSATEELEQVLRLHDDAQAEYSLATLYGKTGADDKARVALEHALRVGLRGADRVEALRLLGHVHERAGRHAQAAKIFESALDIGGEHVETRRALAYAHKNAGRLDAAVHSFETALVLQPGRIDLQQDLAYTYLAAGDHVNACAKFQQIAERDKRADVLAQLDQCQKHLHQSSISRLQLQYAELKSGVMSDAGHVDAAWSESTMLAAAENDASPAVSAVALDVRANELAAREDYAAAIDALQRADAIEPNAERQFRLGLWSQKLGRADDAIAHFALAHARDAATSLYLDTLAYSYLNAGRLDAAIRSFEAALAQQPGRINMMQDLAYAYLRAGDGNNAARVFKNAIDAKIAARDSDSTTDVAAATRSIDGLRREVSELEKRQTLSLYESYRARKGVSLGSSTGAGVIPSQGVVEYDYRVSSSGDKHPVQVFGRVLWGSEAGSLSVENESLQGAVGLRYKPLAQQDFYVSGERLIKIGDNAQNEWLLRASYGWSSGYGMRSDRSAWNTFTAYSDLGYFTDRGIWAAYAELREGRSFLVANNLVLMPHLTVSGLYQDPDPYRGSYSEAGVGVSLRYLFNESRYSASRSSAEFLAQYKKGLNGRIPGGWVATLAILF